MKRILPIVVGCAVGLVGATVWTVLQHRPAAETVSAPLPVTAIVLNAADAHAILPPFQLKPDPSAARSMAMVLPAGASARGTNHNGSAEFRFDVVKAGPYRAWLRAYWRDSCANSVALIVDDGPPYMAGQDALYGTWHWVRAAEYELSAGSHTLALREREDGVAMDQVLLTLDQEFVPSGPVTDGGEAFGIRRFADSFDRSPGHGLEAWKKSGDWDIAFTLDPNRIPYQYSLTGRAGTNGGDAVAWVAGPPWPGAHLEISLCPRKEGRYGLIMQDDDGSDAVRVMLDVGQSSAALRITGPNGLNASVPSGKRAAVGQWSRLEVARWDHSLRVRLDGAQLYDCDDLRAAGGRLGLVACAGEAVFDDFRVSSIPGSPKPPAGVTMPWTGDTDEDLYAIGTFHFTRSKIERGSDYIDLTEEEYDSIRESADVDKLRRGRTVYLPLLGRKEEVVWRRLAGQWVIRDGVLRGVGPGAGVRLWRYVQSDIDMHFRVRLHTTNGLASCATVGLYRGSGVGAGIGITAGKTSDTARVTWLTVEPDDAWHQVSISVDGERMRMRLDDGPWQESKITRGYAGGIELGVLRGVAEFDDVEIGVPRGRKGVHFYAFERRETDWWREGGKWVDHAGITCAMSASWIGLEATGRKYGVLWNRRPLRGDTLVGLTMEANTEWLGWNRNPSHIHHPYNNVCIYLSQGRWCERGYRLEVNARGRTATVLYRNGEEVLVVPQDRSFPMQYTGGHSPFRPRSNRLVLVRAGGAIRAFVNDKEVLVYRDPDPLKVDTLGIGGYRTRVNFTQIEVREL